MTDVEEFIKLQERDIPSAIGQTGKDIVDRAKQFGNDVKNDGLGSAMKSAGKDFANYGLNGGPTGRAIHYATEDAEGGLGKMAHDFTGKQRETAGEFGAAIAGRAAVALAVVLAPTLLKMLPGLTQTNLGGIIQKVLEFFGMGDKKMDLKQLQALLMQSNKQLDFGLESDLAHIYQKARMMDTSKYAKTVIEEIKPLIRTAKATGNQTNAMQSQPA